ncbi:MAG: ABC transporter permease [Chryseolinea sp.]
MKIRATIFKEFLLLVRDPGGMALIFLMPLALVIVMALIQDAPFRDYQEIKLEVLLVDQDNDSLSHKIKRALESSGNITVVNETDLERANKLVQAGDFKASIVLRKGTTQSLKKKTEQLIGKIIRNMGVETPLIDSVEAPAVQLDLYFDPAIKVNYKQALGEGIEKIVAQVQSEWIIMELQSQLSSGENKYPKVKFNPGDMMVVNQQYASDKPKERLALNSVQHNVPAWTMFAMFFILFPLASNFIKEREEGSMLRLRLISGSQFPVIAGKFSFYFFVCMLQFVLMIAVGIFVMPSLGLNKLILGNNVFGILVTACSVGMAATGYGLLIAVFFKTPQQALSFGSISVVILSALGGVWVPVYVMPEVLQTISKFSPLQWGLESFTDLFLRNANTLAILPNTIKLMTFSFVTLIASFLIHKSRIIS